MARRLRALTLALLSLACAPRAGEGDGGGGGASDGSEGDDGGNDHSESDGGAESSGSADGAESSGSADGSNTTGSHDGFRIRDQSGAEFAWVCDADGNNCELGLIEGVSPPLPPCLPDYEPSYRVGGGRFFEILGRCTRFLDDVDGMVWGDGWSRFAVCDADEDCPPLAGSYLCQAGLCQDLAQGDGLPIAREMRTLCYGDAPRYVEPEPDTWPLVLNACPGADEDNAAACESVPAGCIDPR